MSTQTLAQEHKFLAAGEWKTSPHPVEIRSPYNGEVVGITYEASPEQVEQAVQAASQAFHQTRSLPTWRRAEILQNIVQALKAQQETIARLIALEAGKPIKMARAEATRAVLTFTDALEESKRIRGEWLPLDLDANSTGRFALVRRFPVGPVLAITPFNFPVNLVAHKLAPALACGASAILKPPPQAPLSTMGLARIAHEAGAPPGAVNSLLCGIPEAQGMVEDDRLKVLSFTGSAAVGWALKAKAGKKRVVLELGGNAGVAIHSDANLDFAADRCVMGGFAYSGQVCISVQRIYVHQPAFDEFASKLLDRVKRLRLGDPLSEQTDMGPMISAQAAQRAEGWIQDAVNAGAHLLAGGERDGSFLQPTVLTRTKPEMNVCAEEVFAPVVTLESYDNIEDALARINDSPYGLQAGVFTNDMRAIMQAFEKLEAGGIIVNDVPTYRADPMPYGGTKDSGIGREGVRYAIQEFTEPRVLVVNPSGA
ncbi:MAG: aldehyde dehydrogenase family protein [Acidobacteria bacterium]|nr:aldehyde dehydrogenase family protein [Acidobacteriota bacterium]